jgi:hypothetical protein
VASEDLYLFKHTLTSILEKDILYKKQWIVQVETAVKALRLQSWKNRQLHIERRQRRLSMMSQMQRFMEGWLSKRDRALS